MRGIERHLHDAGAITQVDEHETAEITTPVNPPSESDALSGVLEAKRAAKRIA